MAEFAINTKLFDAAKKERIAEEFCDTA